MVIIPTMGMMEVRRHVIFTLLHPSLTPILSTWQSTRILQAGKQGLTRNKATGLFYLLSGAIPQFLFLES